MQKTRSVEQLWPVIEKILEKPEKCHNGHQRKEMLTLERPAWTFKHLQIALVLLKPELTPGSNVKPAKALTLQPPLFCWKKYTSTKANSKEGLQSLFHLQESLPVFCYGKTVLCTSLHRRPANICRGWAWVLQHWQFNYQRSGLAGISGATSN